jgi:hypothetical protein
VNVHVVSDATGRIISMSTFGDAGAAPSGIGNAGVVLDKGQRLHALDVPADLQARSLVELTDMLKVEVRGSRARLVPVGTTKAAKAKKAAPPTKATKATKKTGRR